MPFLSPLPFAQFDFGLNGLATAANLDLDPVPWGVLADELTQFFEILDRMAVVLDDDIVFSKATFCGC
mgnify:CR=1 FL=1